MLGICKLFNIMQFILMIKCDLTDCSNSAKRIYCYIEGVGDWGFGDWAIYSSNCENFYISSFYYIKSITYTNL
jgi:hypothetical protein